MWRCGVVEMWLFVDVDVEMCRCGCVEMCRWKCVDMEM